MKIMAQINEHMLCIRCCFNHFKYNNSYNLANNFISYEPLLSLFYSKKKKNAEAQRGSTTCPKSHRWYMVILRFGPRLSIEPEFLVTGPYCLPRTNFALKSNRNKAGILKSGTRSYSAIYPEGDLNSHDNYSWNWNQKGSTTWIFIWLKNKNLNTNNVWGYYKKAFINF